FPLFPYTTLFRSVFSSFFSVMAIASWKRALGSASGARVSAQGEEEGRASSRLGLDPDGAVVALDDLLDEGETRSGAFRLVVLGIEPLEDPEDVAVELSVDAVSIVSDKVDVSVAVALGEVADFDELLGGGVVLQGVRDEVAEHLLDVDGVADARGELAEGDDARALGDRRGFEHLGDVLDHLVRVDLLDGEVLPADA